MSVINTTENGGTSTTQVTDTISIDSASGNNRALVVFVGILDTAPGVTTVTLDPAGSPIVMTPLFDTGGDNLDQGVDFGQLKIGAFTLFDSALPAGAGTYTIQVDSTDTCGSLTFGAYYLEDVTQSVELSGSEESFATNTPSINVGTPSSTSDTLDFLMTSDPAGPFNYTADTGQTEAWKSIYFYVMCSSYGTGQATHGWTNTDSTPANNLQAYVSLAGLGTTLSADAGTITLTGGDATLGATGVISESPTTWFNGEWWRVPTWGTSWWPLAGSITLSAEPSTITITGGDATLSDSTGDVTLDVDLGTITLTGGDAKLSVPLQADAGVITLTGGDATFSIEFTSDIFDISKIGTFDNLGIRYGTDVAFNATLGTAAGIGYKIVSRVDVDTIRLDGIFGDPPQNYQILKQVAETSVPARIELEFNGTDWVLVSNTPLGL